MSNCITNDIKTYKKGGLMVALGLKSVTYGVCFTMFPQFLRFSLIFMTMQISLFASLAMR